MRAYWSAGESMPDPGRRVGDVHGDLDRGVVALPGRGDGVVEVARGRVVDRDADLVAALDGLQLGARDVAVVVEPGGSSATAAGQQAHDAGVGGCGRDGVQADRLRPAGDQRRGGPAERHDHGRGPHGLRRADDVGTGDQRPPDAGAVLGLTDQHDDLPADRRGQPLGDGVGQGEPAGAERRVGFEHQASRTVLDGAHDHAPRSLHQRGGHRRHTLVVGGDLGVDEVVGEHAAGHGRRDERLVVVGGVVVHAERGGREAVGGDGRQEAEAAGVGTKSGTDRGHGGIARGDGSGGSGGMATVRVRPGPPPARHSLTGLEERRAETKASWGISTDPTAFIFFLPSFCFSRSLRLRDTSPP